MPINWHEAPKPTPLAKGLEGNINGFDDMADALANDPLVGEMYKPLPGHRKPKNWDIINGDASE